MLTKKTNIKPEPAATGLKEAGELNRSFGQTGSKPDKPFFKFRK
jgi:hypothetical protein